jgi:putative hemolysin
MTYDGAAVDGARATATWSAVYCLANGSPRKLVRLVRAGRVAPVGIVAVTAVNCVVDGYYGLTTEREGE